MRRILKFRSIKDNSVQRFVDDGIDRYGEETGNRQNLRHAISKRVSAVVDGVSYDGIEKPQLPLFLLDTDATYKKQIINGKEQKAPGEWIMNDRERLPDDVQFEELLHKELSEKQLEVWEKARAQFLAVSVEARKQAAAEVEKRNSSDVAQVISQMVKSVAAQTGGKKS